MCCTRMIMVVIVRSSDDVCRLMDLGRVQHGLVAPKLVQLERKLDGVASGSGEVASSSAGMCVCE